MQFKVKSVAAALAVAGVLVGVPSVVSLAQDAKALQEQRTAFMKQLGGSMGLLSKIAKGEAEYSPAAVAAAETVLANSAKLTSMFPQNSTTAETRAKPEIWADWANFEKAASAVKDPATKLVVAAKTGDKAQIGAALGPVGKACGSCHDTYRKPQT